MTNVPPPPKRSKSSGPSLGLTIQAISSHAQQDVRQRLQHQLELRRRHDAELAQRAAAVPTDHVPQRQAPPHPVVQAPAPLAQVQQLPPVDQEPQDELMEVNEFADIDEFLGTVLMSNRTLAVTKDAFTTAVTIPDEYTYDNKVLDSYAHQLIEKQCATFHNSAKEFFKVAANLKKDVELLKQGKVPRALTVKDSVFQFKKEVKEEFAESQTKANHDKAMQDARRKIAATKAWLQKSLKAVTPEDNASEVLGKIYDKLANTATDYTTGYLLAIQYAVIYLLIPRLRSIRIDIESGLAETLQKKKKREDDEEKERLKFEEFVSSHPAAAFGVFFRELEIRMITLLTNTEKQRAQEYKAVCKKQALTRLQTDIYNMRATLEKEGFPFLSSTTAAYMLERPSTARRRSASANKTRSQSAQSNKSNKSTKSNRSASNGKGKGKTNKGTPKDKGKKPKGKGKGKGKPSGRSTSTTRGRSQTRKANENASRNASATRKNASISASRRSSSRTKPSSGSTILKTKTKQSRPSRSSSTNARRSGI
eukprot:TRINITY_DN51765_c0_g1_i3.p1 TRINITY_DN51765_c0_g1~~TRINITY_DN51765_c0_g1_i3.p1  ORF type:complete len:537 (+),score=97.73 TRINITY_DN51765_c0_g1_i3:177-1787(+)